MTENQRIKEIRKILDYTQEELASRLGVKHSTISRIERGTLAVSKRIKITLEARENINIEWLEKGSGDIFLEDSKTYGESDRIGKIINYSGLNLIEFCRKIGYNKPDLLTDQITKGKKPDKELLYKILNNFPEIRRDWLFYGNGKMIKEKENNENSENKADLYKELYEMAKQRNKDLEAEIERLKKEIERLKS